jgi:hypothetical protein
MPPIAGRRTGAAQPFMASFGSAPINAGIAVKCWRFWTTSLLLLWMRRLSVFGSSLVRNAEDLQVSTFISRTAFGQPCFTQHGRLRAIFAANRAVANTS